MQPTELLAIIAAAKKETAKAVKDALPTIADMVRKEVDAKEVKTIADVAVTLKGDKGDKGDTGEVGPQGETGPKGDKGDQGPQGVQGPKGDAGINGIDGRDGRDGKDGLPGRNGANGKDGVGVAEVAIGDDGHLYVALDNGRVIDAGVARGRDGKDGKSGAIVYGGGGGGSGGGSGSGSQGPAGADGASAYDVAVANGFSGTESEWLDSLIGATGPQGPAGPQGATGDTGPAGPAGVGVPAGGTTGQVLTKTSGTDYATAWQTPSAGAITYADASLGADVTLTLNNTWYDGPAVTLGAGTWLINITGHYRRNTTGAANVAVRAFGGAAIHAHGETTHFSLNGVEAQVSSHGIAVLTGSTVITMQMMTSTGNVAALMKADTASNPQGNKATRITAIKLA